MKDVVYNLADPNHFNYTVTHHMSPVLSHEFVAAEKFFAENPDAIKFSCTVAGDPIMYPFSDKTTRELAYSILNYQEFLYYILRDSKTQQRKLHCVPSDVKESLGPLLPAHSFSKMPAKQKKFKEDDQGRIITHSFYKIMINAQEFIVAQMPPRTCLGFGTYGVVKLLVTKEGKKFALKKINITADISKRAFEREARLSLQVGLSLGNFIVPNSTRGRIILPYFSDTFSSLSLKIAQTVYKSPDHFIPVFCEILRYFVRAAESLKRCNLKKSIVHTDIKPNNIFITRDGDVELGDLGLAQEATDQGYTNVRRINPSKPNHWLAPEVSSRGEKYSIFSDLFALGKSFDRFIAKISPALEMLSESLVVYALIITELQKFIQRMTADEQRRRPRHAEIVESLEMISIKAKQISEGRYSTPKQADAFFEFFELAKGYYSSNTVFDFVPSETYSAAISRYHGQLKDFYAALPPRRHASLIRKDEILLCCDFTRNQILNRKNFISPLTLEEKIIFRDILLIYANAQKRVVTYPSVLVTHSCIANQSAEAREEILRFKQIIECIEQSDFFKSSSSDPTHQTIEKLCELEEKMNQFNVNNPSSAFFMGC